jgi:predicted nucleotidyltransferase
MVTTRQEALDITAKVREGLEAIYKGRLRGVYLYGSAARDQLTPDSDIDIAVVLDEISSRFAEHERTSQLAADLSLEYDTVVTLLFVTGADLADGTFLIYRTIKREGIPA